MTNQDTITNRPTQSQGRSHRVRRFVAFVALSATPIGAAVASPAASASAAPIYHVAGTGNGVYYRYAAFQNAIRGDGGLYDGDTLDLSCQVMNGDPVGAYANRHWYYAHGGRGKDTWINDHWTDTPVNANVVLPGLPMCTTNSGTPGIQGMPGPAVSTVDKAIAWAQGHLGQNYDSGYCLQFVADAYRSTGKGIDNSYSAVTWWNSHGGHHGDMNVPRGAFVFWGPTPGNSAGHVALAEGGDRAVSTAERQFTTVHELSISDRSRTRPYLGWIMP